MNRGVIIFVMLLLIPAAVAQLSVFHRLSELSADGGATSVDPDNDGRINQSALEPDLDWTKTGTNLTTTLNGTVTVGNSSSLAKLTVSAHDYVGAALRIFGNKLGGPSDDNATYVFITDRPGQATWGLQAQDDEDFGIHLSGRDTFVTVQNDSGFVGIGNGTGSGGPAGTPSHELFVHGSVNITGQYHGDGSALTGISPSLSCSTTSSFAAATEVTLLCASGTMVSGGVQCAGFVQASEPSGNGWRGACSTASTRTYVRCC